MITEMQTLIDKYVAWLKDKTSLRQLDDWIEITTPYLDRHNDYLHIDEDVVAWMELHEIRYTPRVKFTGKSGYDHLFDFVIPKSRQLPERILQTINRPSRDTAQVLASSWIDTKEVRPTDSRAYAVLNDADHIVPPGVVDALKNYDVIPVPWTRREEVWEELAA